MSENKDNKLTLINEKPANDYLTHTCAGNMFEKFFRRRYNDTVEIGEKDYDRN